MSLGMEERQVKSFWDRPEGSTGMIAIVLGALGIYAVGDKILAGLNTLSAILGTMVGIASQTIFLIILGTIIFSMLYVMSNKKFQTLARYFFKSAMRKVTSVFVEIDPIGIMRNYVDDLRKKRGILADNRDRLQGQLVTLDRQIKSNMSKSESAMSVAAVAKREGNMAQVSVAGKQAIRMEKLNKESLVPLRNQIEIHLRALKKYYEVTGTVIEDLENEVDAREIERKMITSSWTAIKAAKKILQGGTDEREMFDMAMEFVVEDYGMKLGEIESFIENSKGFVDGLDMQNLSYEAEALKRLQEWEAKADSVLLGNEKAKMLEHDTSTSIVNTGIGLPAAGSVDYAELIKR